MLHIVYHLTHLVTHLVWSHGGPISMRPRNSVHVIISVDLVVLNFVHFGWSWYLGNTLLKAGMCDAALCAPCT